jgi:hypothetical protein
MGKEIACDADEMEQEAAMRCAEVHVKKLIRKYVYALPSGRKLTVILDDEAESIPAMGLALGIVQIA